MGGHTNKPNQTPPSRDVIETTINQNPNISEADLRSYIPKINEHKSLAQRTNDTNELKKLFQLEDRISQILQNRREGRQNISQNSIHQRNKVNETFRSPKISEFDDPEKIIIDDVEFFIKENINFPIHGDKKQHTINIKQYLKDSGVLFQVNRQDYINLNVFLGDENEALNTATQLAEWINDMNVLSGMQSVDVLIGTYGATRIRNRINNNRKYGNINKKFIDKGPITSTTVKTVKKPKHIESRSVKVTPIDKSKLKIQDIQKKNQDTKPPKNSNDIEKVNTLDLKTNSEFLLNNAEINFQKALDITAKILKVEPTYDETFIKKLKGFQTKNALKPDGILGDKSLGILLYKNSAKLDIFPLSKNSEVIAFHNAIKSNTVTTTMLESIQKTHSNFLSNTLKKNNDGTYTSDSFYNDGMTNRIISKKLYSDFKKSANGKNERYKEIFKNDEKNADIEAKKLVQHSLTIAGIDGLSPEYQKILQTATKVTPGTPPIAFPEGSFEAKALKTVDAIKGNPILMAGALVGFIMFIFGKRDGFAKAGFFGLLAVVGGPSLLKTAKETGEIWGIKFPTDEKAKAAGAAAVTTLSDYGKKAANTIAEKTGVTYEKIAKSFSSKNNAIETSMLANNPKLDQKKVTAVKDISGDSKFREVKIESVTTTKISELGEDIQEKLKKAGIEEKSDEYKAYLKTLSEKIGEANKDNKLKTVGDFFEKTEVNIDGEDIGVVAGVGVMTWGVLTKSPAKFFLGAGVVTESLTGVVREFFTSGDGKEVTEKAKNILNKYQNRTKLYIESKTNLSTELIKSVSELVLKGDFDGIKQLAKDNTKYTKELEKIAARAEENDYAGKVESKIDSDFLPTFIKNIANSTGNKITEIMDSYDKKIETYNKSIESIIKLRDDIISTTLSNKDTLIAKLDVQIATIEAEVEIMKAEQEVAKTNIVIKLEKEKKALDKRKTELSEKTFTSDQKREKAHHKLDMVNINKEIEAKESELEEAQKILGVILNKNIEEPESTEELQKSIRIITKINNSTDLLGLVSNKGPLSSSNLKEVTAALKEIAIIKGNYSGNNKTVKDLILAGENAVDTLLLKSGDIAEAILNKITVNDLSDYPKNEITNFRNMFNEPDLISIEKFNKALTKKKQEVFDEVIEKNGISIKELVALRNNFLVEGKNGSKRINEKLKTLAETTTVDKVVAVNKLIVSSELNSEEKSSLIKKNIIAVYNGLKSKTSLDFKNKNKIINLIEDLYGKENLKVKETKVTPDKEDSKATEKDAPDSKIEEPKKETKKDAIDALLDSVEL